MRLISFFVLASLSRFAAAQPKIATPVLAYAYDAGERAIRAVRGIPGAAVIAERVEVGFAIAAAAVSPQQNYALAVPANEAEVRLIRWNSSAPASSPLNGAMTSVDHIVFSPSGSAAVLSDSRSGRLQLVTGLPDSAMVRDLQAAGNRSPDGIAVADDGVAAVSSDSVSVIGIDGNAVALPLPGGVVALAFDVAAHDLLAASRSGDVYLARNVDAGANITRVYAASEEPAAEFSREAQKRVMHATGRALTADPIAIQFSPDHASAFVATATGVIAAIDLVTGASSTISCDFALTGLHPFGHAGLFRLTEIADGPVFLFDGVAGRRRLWFVPAEQRGTAQ